MAVQKIEKCETGKQKECNKAEVDYKNDKHSDMND